MTQAGRDAAARRQRAQTIALWRWSLIEPAMDAGLSSRQRGRVVRAIAGREHAGPFGGLVSVSRKSIDPWITARRAGGFDALVPAPRQCTPRSLASCLSSIGAGPASIRFLTSIWCMAMWPLESKRISPSPTTLAIASSAFSNSRSRKVRSDIGSCMYNWTDLPHQLIDSRDERDSIEGTITTTSRLSLVAPSAALPTTAANASGN
jgi:hypothetical protein